MSYSFVTPWTVALQAPLSVEFPTWDYWSELLFSTPGDLPNPGIEPTSPALTGRFFTTEPPSKPLGDITQPQIKGERSSMQSWSEKDTMTREIL